MKNDFIILVTEYAATGSGYSSIARKLIRDVGKLYPNTDIVVLGLSYKNEEHDENARIVAARSFSDIPVMLHNIVLSGAAVRAIIVALDIPLQVKIIEWIHENTRVPIKDIPYIGVFPLEAPPLSMVWAASIEKMAGVFVLTDFAVREIKRHGIDARRFPLSIDTDFWRPPTDSEKRAARGKFMIPDNAFMVLMVADNQERKNLSAAVSGFSKFILDEKSIQYDERGYVIASEHKVPDTEMHIVTRVNSPFGWDFTDLLFRNGVMPDITLHERGLPMDDLRDLYFAADVLLSTSKAEGLALPVLEAIACKLPVIAVDATATKEHLSQAGGILMQPSYTIIDPFGNEERYIVTGDTVAMALQEARDNLQKYDIYRDYIIEKSDGLAFIEALKGVIDGKA